MNAEIELALPEAWWQVDPRAADEELERWIDERIAERFAEQFADGGPSPSPSPAEPDEQLRVALTGEWSKLLRAARSAGAVLFAGGWAIAEGTDRPLVAASLLLSPIPAAASREAEEPGPTAAAAEPVRTDGDAVATDTPPASAPTRSSVTLDSEMGRVLKTTQRSTTPLPQGWELLGLEVAYTFCDLEPQWSLRFSTPSVRHAEQLIAVFDDVAAGFRVSRPSGA
ncbi:hypothetical protein KDL01_19370 [Actinospica durhamensis]|uniref:Uncharacterized protein n=1 Tax=Actinospica durhamensis TaxID=1508375 RepID=A0A941EWW8_9ACTN|nr:hypothetical protein [Actinospica durhamensis]MBR7835444.1 hypothetical protein [Actinospica durhamensis]